MKNPLFFFGSCSDCADITGANGSSETMGNFVDTASDDGVFSSDACDGDGITSRCCLGFGTRLGEYLET